MTRFALALALVFSLGCASKHSSESKPPEPQKRITFLQLQLLPRVWCATTTHGVEVFTAGGSACPFTYQIERWTVEAAGRVDGIRHNGGRIEIKPSPMADGIRLVVHPFMISDCGEGIQAAELVPGCSQGAYAYVRDKNIEWTWPHEFGHFILERTGIDPDGDVFHQQCGFWFMLVNRKCGMDVRKQRRGWKEWPEGLGE